MLKQINEIEYQNYDLVCIAGDFNYPTVEWKGTGGDERGQLFKSTLQENFLTQMVQQDTRKREGQRSNLLDLVIVSDENRISDIKHEPPLGEKRPRHSNVFIIY